MKKEKAAPGDRPRRRWLRRSVVGLVVLVGLACLSPFAVVGIASWGRILTVDGVGAHDVAIVFGAGLDQGKPSSYLAARLGIARDLYMAGKVKVILVSGDNLTPYHNEPDAMRDWLIEQGVPAERVVADYAGEDTYATCVRARQTFGVTGAILVSQTYHLPRAVATCRLVGVDAVGVGDESVRGAWPSLWRKYQLREIPADANMLVEVLTRRQPILGPYEPWVDQALGR